MLTRTAGLELARRNILVVGVGPGAGGDADQPRHVGRPSKARAARANHTAGAHGKPEEIASVVAF